MKKRKGSSWACVLQPGKGEQACKLARPAYEIERKGEGGQRSTVAARTPRQAHA